MSEIVQVNVDIMSRQFKIGAQRIAGRRGNGALDDARSQIRINRNACLKRRRNSAASSIFI